jgi:hypothetical protein
MPLREAVDVPDTCRQTSGRALLPESDPMPPTIAHDYPRPPTLLGQDTTIGAKVVGVENFPCPVSVDGDLCSRTDLHDKVRSFNFYDFAHICNRPHATASMRCRETLGEYLERCKAIIERSDPVALDEMHEWFVPVVEEIIMARGLYRSELRTRIDVCRYAKPTIRGAGSTFAGYLHNDAWIDTQDSSVAMVNVWSVLHEMRLRRNVLCSAATCWAVRRFVLNEIPPRNHLVFYEASASNVHREWGARQAHMVHGLYEDVLGKTVFFDEQMCWGKFYCFVSGQRTTVERVLLHGAMDMPRADSAAPARRSAEMRFTVRVRGDSQTDTSPESDAAADGLRVERPSVTPERPDSEDMTAYQFEDLDG